jgi:hypothetical protein
MRGNFVQVVIEPQYETVGQYVEYLKRNSPNPGLKYDLMDPDIECVCCSQKAPHVAAAELKVEDQTPVNTELSGKPGKQLWLCADCFNNGVRPKYIYFGDVKWNKMGRKIKNRVEQNNSHPWR